MSKIPLHINEPVEPITTYEAAWAKLTNLNSKAIHLEPRHATALVAEINRLNAEIQRLTFDVEQLEGWVYDD